MKTTIKFIIAFTFFSAVSISNSYAQGLIDGFFNKKGDVKLSLSYTFGTYDEFYVGDMKTGPVPAHNTIDQTIYNFYGNYAISDNVMVIVNLPYISSKGNGDPDPINGTTEQKDLQDVSVFVKWAPYVETKEHGTMTYFVAVGGSYAFGYEPSGILSNGTGAPAIDGKLGLQYKSNCGLFGALIGGYTLRGKADNNLDIGEGEDFDAPNSFNTTLKLGYAANKFYADVWYDSQLTSGDAVDIGGDGFFGNFPETRVNYSRIGANVFYPFTSNIGVSAGAGTLVDGRNIGDSTFYTGGLILSF